MPYKFVDGKLEAETNQNYLSMSSPKRALFDALKFQVDRAEAAEAERDELQKETSDLKMIMSCGDEHIEALRAERNKARAQLEHAQTRIDQLEALRDELAHKIDRGIKFADVLLKERGDLRDQLEQAKRIIDEQRNTIQDLTP